MLGKDFCPSPHLPGRRPLSAEGGPKWGQRGAGQIFHLVELVKVEPVLVTLLSWEVNALTPFGRCRPYPHPRRCPPQSTALPSSYCRSRRAALAYRCETVPAGKHNLHASDSPTPPPRESDLLILPHVDCCGKLARQGEHCKLKQVPRLRHPGLVPGSKPTTPQIFSPRGRLSTTRAHGSGHTSLRL